MWKVLALALFAAQTCMFVLNYSSQFGRHVLFVLWTLFCNYLSSLISSLHKLCYEIIDLLTSIGAAFTDHPTHLLESCSAVPSIAFSFRTMTSAVHVCPVLIQRIPSRDLM